MPDKFNELLLKPDIIELYKSGITPDYGYLMNGRFEKDMIKTLCPLKTLSGNPITWEASDTEYLFPVVSLEPKQAGSGDPSPDNVRPISGYDSVTVNVRGKNLVGNFKEATHIEQGITWTIENNRIIAQGETGDFFSTTSKYFNLVFQILPATYILSYKTTDNGISFVAGIFKSDDTPIAYLENSVPYTLTENNAYIRIYAQIRPNTQVNGSISDIQLEIGSTPTPYEPYQPGTTAQLSLPKTIYGGTVDAVTGVGSKEYLLLELTGKETWIDYNYASKPSFYAEDMLNTNYARADGICDRGIITNRADLDGAYIWLGVNNTNIYFIDAKREFNVSSIAEWKSYLATQYEAKTPVTICYKLATPEPFQATGNQPLTSLLGYNTIYTNGDSITLTEKQGG